MIAQNTMKMNGKWYKAGEEVSSATPLEETGNSQHTKTEINRMSTSELQSLAIENGIDGADEMTGADLKKVLIEHFKL